MESKYNTEMLNALKYITIPPSSVPVEPICIVAGNICRTERCSLIDGILETLMFLRVNYDI